jgi:hypothetical protein
MNYIRIKTPGNYPVARKELCGDGCCCDIIWENQDCAAGEEFEEWQLDTAFMNQEDFEEIQA